MSCLRRASCAAILLWAAPAAAVSGQADRPADRPPSSPHAAEGADIIVTGVRRRSTEVVGGTSVLGGTELTRSLRSSLGETLARQPGVSASSFGPTASRPILRGLSGDRIRILTDSIGGFDVSSSSADHAVAINPLIADRIEVLRGPAALLFGSSAIGGVINVIDKRIPRHVPERPFHSEGLLSFASAASERAANLVVDLPVAGGFVLHADGNWSNSDDLSVGGHVLSNPLRRAARASADPAIRRLADLKGRLPNSAASSSELAGGLGYVEHAFNAGLSVTRHRADYGVPARYSLDPTIEAEAPRIDVRQTRYDGRIELPLAGRFDELRMRGGYARYRHDELHAEEEGEQGHDAEEGGTSFFARGGEGRADLVQTVRGGWGGQTGLQAIARRIRIRGEEKFLPDSRQQQLGLFTVQHLERGPLRLEAGMRLEHSILRARADPAIGNPRLEERFRTLSLAAGLTRAVGRRWRVGLSASRSMRAPSIEELFANGPHAGSQAFERGEPGLDPERSIGIEAGVRHDGDRADFSLTLYRSRFSNFIYQAPGGETIDDLPLFVYRQGNASHAGFEAELELALGRAFGIDWSGDAIADAVRATIRGFGPAPQIPPLRILAGLTGKSGRAAGRLEIERSFAQRRTAPLETGTPGFTLVNASLDWQPLDRRPELILVLAGENLFDVVARRHSSLLKNHAPLAGRDIRLTARLAL